MVEPTLGKGNGNGKDMKQEPYRQMMEQLKPQLDTLCRMQVTTIGWKAEMTKTIIERGIRGIQEQDHPEQETTQRDACPEMDEMIGAAGDLAVYLDGTRPTPESNRNGILHAQDWNTGLAMHLVRDVEIALDEARTLIPEKLYADALRSLLELTIEIAVTGSGEDAKPFLDQMVKGELADP